MFFLSLICDINRASAPEDDSKKLEISIKKNEIFDKIRSGVVMIQVKGHYIADKSRWRINDAWDGTGFLIDKEKGLIVTSKRNVGTNSVATYELRFSDGEMAEANLLYDDPFHDFAFLMVNPKLIPTNAKPLEFSEKESKINERLFGVGNIGGDNFSIITGTTISHFENEGSLGAQLYKFSGVVIWDASGSPVVDDMGKLKGLVSGEDFTSGTFLPIAYIKDAYEYLKKDQIPVRKTSGIIPRYEKLRDIKELGLIPEDAFKLYQERFPDAFDNIVMLDYIPKNYPVRDVLNPGDIIWSVNGELLGPRLYYLEKIVNQSEEIDLEIYREGVLKKLKIKCSDLPRPKRKFISFSGAIFSEDSIDAQFWSQQFDNNVVLQHKARTSGFKGQGGVLKNIAGFKIENLEALKKIIPQINNKTLIKAIFGSKYEDLYDKMSFIKHQKEFDAPLYFEFDYQQKKWKVEKLK